AAKGHTRRGPAAARVNAGPAPATTQLTWRLASDTLKACVHPRLCRLASASDAWAATSPNQPSAADHRRAWAPRGGRADAPALGPGGVLCGRDRCFHLPLRLRGGAPRSVLQGLRARPTPGERPPAPRRPFGVHELCCAVPGAAAHRLQDLERPYGNATGAYRPPSSARRV